MKKPAKNKVQHSPGPRPRSKGSVILSFTVPVDLEKPMNAAAEARGLSRSAYLRWLVERDLRAHPRLAESAPEPLVLPKIRRAK